MYIYATKDGFTKLSTIASHQSFVTHVDFSSDGNYVQSADGASSLLFADAATGIQIPSECAELASRESCRVPTVWCRCHALSILVGCRHRAAAFHSSE